MSEKIDKLVEVFKVFQGMEDTMDQYHRRHQKDYNSIKIKYKIYSIVALVLAMMLIFAFLSPFILSAGLMATLIVGMVAGVLLPLFSQLALRNFIQYHSGKFEIPGAFSKFSLLRALNILGAIAIPGLFILFCVIVNPIALFIGIGVVVLVLIPLIAVAGKYFYTSVIKPWVTVSKQHYHKIAGFEYGKLHLKIQNIVKNNKNDNKNNNGNNTPVNDKDSDVNKNNNDNNTTVNDKNEVITPAEIDKDDDDELDEQKHNTYEPLKSGQGKVFPIFKKVLPQNLIKLENNSNNTAQTQSQEKWDNTDLTIETVDSQYVKQYGFKTNTSLPNVRIIYKNHLATEDEVAKILNDDELSMDTTNI